MYKHQQISGVRGKIRRFVLACMLAVVPGATIGQTSCVVDDYARLAEMGLSGMNSTGMGGMGMGGTGMGGMGMGGMGMGMGGTGMGTMSGLFGNMTTTSR